MPYIPFTDEQKILANSVDLEQFLRMRGEKLERAGIEHKLIYYDSSGKHDSITIRGSKWFDHKNQTGGGAIKFMQEFYGMDFQTAVTIIFYLKEFYAVNAVQHINVLAVKTLYFGHAGPIITKQAIVPMDESPKLKFMQHL